MIHEMDEVLLELSNGKYKRVMVAQQDGSNQGVAVERTSSTRGLAKITYSD